MEHKEIEVSMKPFVVAWVCVLIVTGIELAIAHAQPESRTLFLVLMVLGLVNAALTVMFFMSLRERKRLAWSLIPAFLFVMAMTIEMFPDAGRLNRMGTHVPPPVESSQPSQ